MINIIPITDFSACELDMYARLSENQLRTYYEPNGGLFVAESPKVIMRALDAGYTPLSFLMEEKHVAGEAKELLEKCNSLFEDNIPVYTAPLNVLKQLTGFELTRGCLCVMKRKVLPSLEELCENATRIAILEDVVNPTNVGAIMRSAAALGMDAVILTSGCSDPLYRRAARVSMGTVFQIPWTIFPQSISVSKTDTSSSYESPAHTSYWPNHGIKRLHELGFQTAAMALSNNSVSIDDPRLLQEKKLAIILGTEGDGLTPNTIASCDYTVKIPMSFEVDSLNVAAASAVAFWQLKAR